MPRRVRLAMLFAFVLHGFLILTAQYRLSFDAYTHMFFADHYRMDWWSLWEPRWYTGFSITSYPPLVHQMIGLLGRLTGIDAAFALILWVVLTMYPLAAYAFSRVFTGRVVAGYAALGAALLPSIYLSAHNFGQLPTLAATLFALFGLAALAEFLRRGDGLSGALAVALFAVVMAAHHATLLFLPWVIAGLVLHLFLNQKNGSALRAARFFIFAFLATIAGLVVIWPFWDWGRGQSIQVPIDHLSRHNFFVDPLAIVVFFLPMYGPLMVLIPFALWKGLQKRYTGLSLAFLGLFLLGLGGTTPLPRLFFGAGWEWLIYDRFAFWASLALLPFFGAALPLLRRRASTYFRNSGAMRWVGAQMKRRSPNRVPGAPMARARRWVTLSVFIFLGGVAFAIGLLPSVMTWQPAQIDMQPIIDFLAQDDRSQWRYLTFGFGDQLAYLSRLTKATTIDGSYHTARALPELRESGLPQIDVAFWTVKGVSALGPILQKSGGHGVRWGFVNHPAYVPVLKQNGWVMLATLSNGIQVWENPSAVLPPPSQAPPDNPLASFSWGVFPLLSLAVAGALAAMRLRPILAQKVLLGIHQIALGLLPLALCFWYYLTLVGTQVPDVYFTYTDALLFASDALALVALIAWLIVRFTSTRHYTPGTRPPNSEERGIWGRWPPGRWGLALCLLASISVIWSVDWRVSLYVSLHLWLVFGVFLSIKDRTEAWRAIALGFCAALILQILIGFWQFGAQSTAFLQPLGLNWPGSLNAAMQGASIVQLPDGTRWLRAYGTFPHPNILAGVIIAFLAGPVAIFLSEARQRLWAVVLCALSAALLILTFSRGAWLGLAAAGLVLALQRLKLDRKRLLVIALASLAGLLAAAAPLYNLIFTRAGGTNVATETFSNQARIWLIQQTFEIIKDHPILGVGIGTYIVEYARRVPSGYLVEPVHSLPLLMIAELGLPGLLVLAGLGISILLGVLRARSPQAVVFSAALIGLFVAALFDHYLWTLAPGRMLVGLMLGLWASQVKQG